MMMISKIVESYTQGDVTFCEDVNGNLFQQIAGGKVFPVKDGKISYKTIFTKGKYTVKYNLNGVYGFSIWLNGRNLEDRFWSLVDAQKAVNEWIILDKD